ncbi:coenzyme F420-0:L-glutamate ligase [Variovorax humicola]|uniref:Coenzyme F420-0:L-glutamate ligase n=1 Tax=Variovorax humicola TaxID=1769758 RepID=A0ABU8W1C4_9BURK
MASEPVTLTALRDFPMVEPGDDLAGMIIDGLRRTGIQPRDGDVLVLAQKIVSKAEGRYVELKGVAPSARAVELARATGKDPRMVELILAESSEVVKYGPGVLVAEHRLGFVMANAGIDQSNIDHPDGNERALLLPEDPDAACAAIKAHLDAAFGVDFGVVINDSFGRPWRQGVTGVALGAAGLPALLNLIGAPDLFGRTMRITEVAVADELAAAASLVMGQTDAGRPVIHVRGMRWDAPARPAADLRRPRQQDMFR